VHTTCRGLVVLNGCTSSFGLRQQATVWLRNDISTMLRRWCEDSMKSHAMGPRSWNERAQTLEEFVEGQDEVGRSIGIGRLELQPDVFLVELLESIV